MVTKKNRPKKIWVDRGAEVAGEFKKVCQVDGIQICFTTSDNKAAFAERTIRSLKNLLYRYMQDYGYKSKIDSIRPKPELQKKLLDRLDTINYQEL